MDATHTKEITTMYRNLPETITSLTERATLLIDGYVAKFSGLEIIWMADGSGRLAAIVRFHQGDDEFAVRITAPAPADAPVWAQVFGDYETAVLPIAL